ncbi:uncharacterized protein LOC116055576 [Sander lucioperca]|uniref:uncharacterized protein LOC116055576 n=1 Tax=Sander lucioperca TaxID=283035 RepID=UPI00125E7B6E|nr:uncharacterized protein LOC116055576 [Sander lucioperca]
MSTVGNSTRRSNVAVRFDDTLIQQDVEAPLTDQTRGFLNQPGYLLGNIKPHHPASNKKAENRPPSPQEERVRKGEGFSLDHCAELHCNEERTVTSLNRYNDVGIVIKPNRLSRKYRKRSNLTSESNRGAFPPKRPRPVFVQADPPLSVILKGHNSGIEQTKPVTPLLSQHPLAAGVVTPEVEVLQPTQRGSIDRGQSLCPIQRGEALETIERAGENQTTDGFLHLREVLTPHDNNVLNTTPCIHQSPAAERTLAGVEEQEQERGGSEDLLLSEASHVLFPPNQDAWLWDYDNNVGDLNCCDTLLEYICRLESDSIASACMPDTPTLHKQPESFRPTVTATDKRCDKAENACIDPVNRLDVDSETLLEYICNLESESIENACIDPVNRLDVNNQAERSYITKNLFEPCVAVGVSEQPTVLQGESFFNYCAETSLRQSSSDARYEQLESKIDRLINNVEALQTDSRQVQVTVQPAVLQGESSSKCCAETSLRQSSSDARYEQLESKIDGLMNKVEALQAVSTQVLDIVAALGTALTNQERSLEAAEERQLQRVVALNKVFAPVISIFQKTMTKK